MNCPLRLAGVLGAGCTLHTRPETMTEIFNRNSQARFPAVRVIETLYKNKILWRETKSYFVCQHRLQVLREKRAPRAPRCGRTLISELELVGRVVRLVPRRIPGVTLVEFSKPPEPRILACGKPLPERTGNRCVRR